MNKKEPRIVDLKDLQSSSKSEIKTKIIEEEAAQSTISISDIDKLKPKSKTVQIKPTPAKPFDPSLLLTPRFKYYTGDKSRKSIMQFMSKKYDFDRKAISRSSVFLIFALGAIYFISKYILKIENTDNPYYDAFVYSGVQTYKVFADIYMSCFFPILGIAFYTVPFKMFTGFKVQVFFDGLTVPSTMFPNGSPTRKRLSWGDIAAVKYKKEMGHEYLDLLNRNNRSIGHMRLDIDKFDEFKEIVLIYAPEDHPIRNIFNNLKKP